VIFQPEDYAAFLSSQQAFLDALDDPSETVVIGISGQARLDTAVLHQLVEAFSGSPSAGVNANYRYAELVGQLNTFDGVVNVFLPSCFVGRDEALMRGHAAQVNAVDKRTAFETLKIIVGFLFHLNMEYLYAVEAHLGSFINARFNRQFQAPLEAPERIRRDGYRVGTV